MHSQDGVAVAVHSTKVFIGIVSFFGEGKPNMQGANASATERVCDVHCTKVSHIESLEESGRTSVGRIVVAVSSQYKIVHKSVCQKHRTLAAARARPLHKHDVAIYLFICA